MQQLPENKMCADCKGPSPRWASTNLGIFICISCSGIHRKLGTHISQVRSVTLDTWTPAQVAHFQKFGNARAAAYFEACIPEGFRRPAAGDSMQMEKFIRDKYEKKRFITLENGGLGGAESERALRKGSFSSASTASDMSQSSLGLGLRPPQTYPTYNNLGASIRKGGRPLNYSDTFRSDAPSAPLSAWTRNMLPVDSRNVMATSQASLSRPKNAIQRASTVREIMNMGFPAELAARAAEAAQGDLQRAVEWVLANSPDAHRPPPPPPPKAPQKDLLDFDEPISGVNMNGLQGNGMQASIPKNDGAVKSSSYVQDDFADFADFGAFESALPSATLTATASTASQGANLLSGSIAKLYSQGGGQSTALQQQWAASAHMPNDAGRALQRSPQQSPLSSAGYTQAWRVGSAAQGENQQAMQSGYSFRPPQTAPLAGVGNPHVAGFGSKQSHQGQGVAHHHGIAQTSPRGAPLPSQRQIHTASPGTAHSSATSTRHFGSTQFSPKLKTLSAQGFTQLPGAGDVRPGESVQVKRAPMNSKSNRGETPNEFPSFTWPMTSNSMRPPTKEANYLSPANTQYDTAAAAGAGTSVDPPRPPPPPPQEMSITDSDVPPPPESPPPSKTEQPTFAVMEEPSVSAKTQQPSEAMKANQKSDIVTESSAPQGEQEDPFAALSMLAMGTATAKMKEKLKQPINETSADRAENLSNEPAVPPANNSTGVDLDNLLS